MLVYYVRLIILLVTYMKIAMRVQIISPSFSEPDSVASSILRQRLDDFVQRLKLLLRWLVQGGTRIEQMEVYGEAQQWNINGKKAQVIKFNLLTKVVVSPFSCHFPLEIAGQWSEKENIK